MPKTDYTFEGALVAELLKEARRKIPSASRQRAETLPSVKYDTLLKMRKAINEGTSAYVTKSIARGLLVWLRAELGPGLKLSQFVKYRSGPLPPHEDEFESADPGLLRLADVIVNDVRVKRDFTAFAGGLPPNHIRCQLVATDAPIVGQLPRGWKRIREDVIRRLKRGHAVVANDPTFSLVRVRERREAIGGKRLWPDSYEFILDVRPAEYFNFVFPHWFLDESFVVNGRSTTPRRAFDIGTTPTIDDVPRLSRQGGLTFRVAVNTILVTRDDYVVVPIRSEDVAIMANTAHSSAAEGMTAEDMEDDEIPASPQPGQLKGRPSVVAACERSLAHELGVRIEHYDQHRIACLGIAMDTLRAQPLIVFYIRSCLLNFEDVHARWVVSQDRFENRQLLAGQRQVWRLLA